MNPTSPLATFYNNISEREGVKAFMITCLKEMAVDMAFEGKDNKGVKEAKDCIDLMFGKLDEAFGSRKEVVISNSK